MTNFPISPATSDKLASVLGINAAEYINSDASLPPIQTGVNAQAQNTPADTFTKENKTSSKLKGALVLGTIAAGMIAVPKIVKNPSKFLNLFKKP